MTRPKKSLTIADTLERLARLAHSVQFAGELTPTQWDVLRFLGRANRYSNNPRSVTAFLGATKGTVSQTLIGLENKGLLERRQDPSHGRRVQLHLTKSGRRVLEKDPLVQMVQAAEALSGEKQDALADGLTSMLLAWQRANDRQTFGVCRTCKFFKPNDAPNEAGGPHRCGLTLEPLNDEDGGRICAEHTMLAEV